jgi:hypothetical protein
VSATRLVLIVCFCLLGLASAQITVEMGDIPRAIGDSFQYKYVQGNATVDNGSTGGPHTWTFDTSTYVGYVLTTEVVDKASTPFAALFPDANSSSKENRGVYILYTHSVLSADAMLDCGYGAYFGSGGIVGVNVPPAVHIDFPMTLGTSWTTTFTNTDTVADTVHVAVNHHDCFVDAWGTAIAPSGSYPCLRENYLARVVTTTYVNGVPSRVDTSFTRRYWWFSKGSSMVAMTHSMEGDTSSNFTQADDIMVLVRTNTGGVQEPQGRAGVPRLTISPSPCRGMAAVQCALERPAPATISVIDPMGRVVLRRERSLSAGRFSLLLDLSRQRSGVYLVKLNAGAFSSTQKLVVQTR